MIYSSNCIGVVTSILCNDCIDGAFILKNSSFIMENSIFQFTSAKIYSNIKLSAIHSESNPRYFVINNSKFINITNFNNGPVILYLYIYKY